MQALRSTSRKRASTSRQSNRDRIIYTFENTCREEPGLKLNDDTYKIVVNTKGTRGDVSPELMEIIRYLDNEEISGDFSRALDRAVQDIKSNEERRLEYMMLYVRDNEMIAKGHKEGLEQGLQQGQIIQAIKMYRELVHFNDSQIISAIMSKFNLSREEAEKYVSAQPA